MVSPRPQLFVNSSNSASSANLLSSFLLLVDLYFIFIIIIIIIIQFTVTIIFVWRVHEWTCSDQYESIDGYATVNDVALPSYGTKAASSSSSSTTTVPPDSDAGEFIYLAVESYSKRKSGEVDLKQGGTVSVMQRELSGTMDGKRIWNVV